MTAKATDALITEFICGEILRDPGYALDPAENLFAGGQIDSVGIMRLVRHLEESLGLAIPPGDLVPENFRTVEVMAAYIDGQRDKASA